MRKRIWCLAAAVICAPVSRVAAQGQSAAIGYLTLLSTPAGGLSPLVRQWMLPDPSRGVGIESQWGHMAAEGASLNALTVGAAIPIAAGRADIGLAAGFQKLSCDQDSCDGHLIASTSVEGRIIQSRMGNATFTLGMSAKIGFAKPAGATLWSASTSVPLSLAIGKRNGVQFVPFVSPGFGWGSISEGGSSASGSRFMLGGGLGLMGESSGVGLTLGAQKIFVDGGKTVFGAGLTLSHL
jgi:hypothetical protein